MNRETRNFSIYKNENGMMAYILLVSHFTIVFVGDPSTFDLRGWWLTFFRKKELFFAVQIDCTFSDFLCQKYKLMLDYEL